MTAADEQFLTGSIFQVTGNLDRDLREFVRRMSPELIEIADTGTAGDQHVLRHGRGRRPWAVLLLRQVLAGGTAARWYQLPTDDAWTAIELNLRFDQDNARVLLGVF